MNKEPSLVFGCVLIIWSIVEMYCAVAFSLNLRTASSLIYKTSDPNFFYFVCGVKLFVGLLGVLYFFVGKDE